MWELDAIECIRYIYASKLNGTCVIYFNLGK